MDIEKRQTESDAIDADFFAERLRERSAGVPVTAPVVTVNLDDAQLLDKAREAKNGAKFAALFDRGDWRSVGFKSQSKADLWLASQLAFWTARDQRRIDNLFRLSRLMRDEWDRRDYRQRTLDQAIRGCSQTYRLRPQNSKHHQRKTLSTKQCNAASIASLIEDYFAQDKGRKLYLFRDGCFRPKGEEYIRTRVRRIVPSEKWTSHLANETVEYVRVGSQQLWDYPPLNKVNVQNGLLNLDSLELEPHSPEFLWPLSFPYDMIPAPHARHGRSRLQRPSRKTRSKKVWRGKSSLC
jgi:hypothetical protein